MIVHLTTQESRGGIFGRVTTYDWLQWRSCCLIGPTEEKPSGTNPSNSPGVPPPRYLIGLGLKQGSLIGRDKIWVGRR